MAFRHGRRTGIIFQDADLTSYLNEATGTHTVETAETTAFGSDYKTYVVGQEDGTVSLSGMFDGAATAIDAVVEGQIAVEDGGHMLIQQGWSTTDSPGIRVQFCKGELTNYEISSPVSDVVSVSIDVNADGGLWGGVALHDSNGATAPGWQDIAATADTDNSSVDNTASSANGFVAQLHVVANTLDGNLVVTVEDSADDAVFASLGVFTTVSAATTTAEQITGAGTVDRYVRINLNATAATTGSATLAVGFTRL